MRVLSVLAAAVCLAGCGGGGSAPGRGLTVAAAANLSGAMEELAAAFEKREGMLVTVSFGSTAQLAQQLANGAPFDVFLAADVEHVDKLVKLGQMEAGSRAVYARGRLALWVPDASREVKGLADLAGEGVKFVAVAQPELAPYGAAAVEALRKSGAWEQVKGKIVYANNINMARQLAASGNADAALTALPLVMGDKGWVVTVDAGLHAPIEQALGIAAGTANRKAAEAFRGFVLGPEGRAILERRGYELP